jgi:hypothetical protein
MLEKSTANGHPLHSKPPSRISSESQQLPQFLAIKLFKLATSVRKQAISLWHVEQQGDSESDSGVSGLASSSNNWVLSSADNFRRAVSKSVRDKGSDI